MFLFSFLMNDEAERYLKKIEIKLDDPRAFLTKAGLVMLRSIDKNFSAGGRPKRWVKLAPLTKALRRKGGGGGKFAILQDKGRLRTSMASQVGKKQVRIGTNLKKAKTLHFGGETQGGTIRIRRHRRKITQAFGKPISPKTITVKPYSFRIGPKRVPARPFVLFQREDLRAIDRLAIGHVDGATK